MVDGRRRKGERNRRRGSGWGGGGGMKEGKRLRKEVGREEEGYKHH